MGLDDAVRRFTSAVEEYISSREELYRVLREVGISDRTADVFIKNLEDSVRRRIAYSESTNAHENNGPTKQEHVDTTTRFDKWELKDKLKEGEVVTDGENYFYKLNGKVFKNKSLPLVIYNGVKLYYNGHAGKFYMRIGNKRGSLRGISEKMAIDWVRDIIVHAEIGSLDGPVTIYEDFIRTVLPSMRPLARDIFNELLKEAGKIRKLSEAFGGGADADDG